MTTVFTNGTVLTPEIADHLAEWRPHLVEITLYSAAKETYEKISQAPGSFERCKRGIDLLLEREIPLGLKTMAMTLNHGEIHLMKEYADKLGMRFRFDPDPPSTHHPRFRWDRFCGVAFARSSRSTLRLSTGLRRLASDALLVIRNRPKPIDTIDGSRIRRWIWL